LNLSTREIEVEGDRRHSEGSAAEDEDPASIQRGVQARDALELRTAELEAAQARVTDLEQRLRLIHQSRTYRFAWRMWRMRARMRRLLSALRRRTTEEGAEEIQALAPDDVPYAPDDTEVTMRSLPDGPGREIGHPRGAQPAFYYGSRGVRATDPEQSGPLYAVPLLGGLTEAQLARALRALALDGRADGEPIVITDCDALRTLDSAGYLYEYIPPREDWERRLGRNGDDYDDFVGRRLVLIAGTYGLAAVPPTI
jgi:hypothetical protein